MQIKMGKRMVLCVMVGLLAGLTAVHSSGIVQTIAESRASRTLVIDAGHGGFDGGAVGSNGTAEQDINLSIAQRLYGLAGFFGVQAVMTRPDTNALDYDPSRPVRENKISDIKAREQIVQQAANPIFLSIHLNKFSDPQYHGAQVFYSANHAGGRVLAEYLQNSLIYGCDPASGQAGGKLDLFDEKTHLSGGDRRMRVFIQCGRGNEAERSGLP